MSQQEIAKKLQELVRIWRPNSGMSAAAEVREDAFRVGTELAVAMARE